MKVIGYLLCFVLNLIGLWFLLGQEYDKATMYYVMALSIWIYGGLGDNEED